MNIDIRLIFTDNYDFYDFIRFLLYKDLCILNNI